jgi:cytochrome c553
VAWVDLIEINEIELPCHKVEHGRLSVDLPTVGGPMKNLTLMLAIALLPGLIGCSDEGTRSTTQGKGDVAAGKAIAERECKGCHGLDGKGVAPAIPHLAAQRDRYLLASLREYKEGKRTHAALRDVATHMSETDAQNVAAYYASLPHVAPAGKQDAQLVSLYENGKRVAAACIGCHGNEGNSTTAGTPSLAGQQPRYFITATHEYLNGLRETSPMHALIRDVNRLDLESVALYFASQTPAQRSAPPFGDPKAGEPKSAVCGGCHGSHGVSSDAATPSLAGQDPVYLVRSTKAYRSARKHEAMQRAVAGLSDADINDIAAFYAVQKSKPAEKGQALIQDLTDKCNRCHRTDVDNPVMAIPNIRGQDKDYLIMALRAYRDDRRESSVMHKMSLPYGDAVIESLASYYATSPAK